MRTLALLLVMSMLATGCARSGVEGTWVLVSRDLPDGTVKLPPEVIGCLSYANGMRNFNVYWEDPQGNPVSIASVAQFTLTDDEYRETNLYYRSSGLGATVEYDLSAATGVAPVHRSDGRLEFDLPLHDEPTAVFEADRFTASQEGMFVDHWRRVD